MSRKAIYRQLEIGDENYNQFRKTTTKEKPEGELLPEAKNRPVKILSCLNVVSLAFLVIGTMSLCAFAIANLANAKSSSEHDHTSQIGVNAILPQISTNITTTNKATP